MSLSDRERAGAFEEVFLVIATTHQPDTTRSERTGAFSVSLEDAVLPIKRPPNESNPSSIP
ncbi:hypothetical protein [Haladaptatus sp. R4]|uniref:hypothetical protein n=1 Tax=Haladaptatus sp. R4 TaxID=1679489 RepID=UPI000A3ED45D|nr:hypothetical protein [Haladaptatus sp. R4]